MAGRIQKGLSLICRKSKLAVLSIFLRRRSINKRKSKEEMYILHLLKKGGRKNAYFITAARRAGQRKIYMDRNKWPEAVCFMDGYGKSMIWGN